MNTSNAATLASFATIAAAQATGAICAFIDTAQAFDLGEHLVDQMRRHVRHATRHARRAKASRRGTREAVPRR